MIPESYRAIIDTLVVRSGRGEVRWHETSTAGRYAVDLPSASFYVEDLYTQDEMYLTFVVLNDQGQKVDSFDVYQADAQWRLVANLYELAKRTAMHVDEVLKEIQDALRASAPVGQAKVEELKISPPPDLSLGDEIPF